jgi:hypothetical protein
LINDYVKKETRGIASLLNNFGYIMGETFAMAVMFNLTRDIDPTLAFFIVALTLACFGIPISWLTIDAKRVASRYKEWQ